MITGSLRECLAQFSLRNGAAREEDLWIFLVVFTITKNHSLASSPNMPKYFQVPPTVQLIGGGTTRDLMEACKASQKRALFALLLRNPRTYDSYNVFDQFAQFRVSSCKNISWFFLGPGMPFFLNPSCFCWGQESNFCFFQPQSGPRKKPQAFEKTQKKTLKLLLLQDTILKIPAPLCIVFFFFFLLFSKQMRVLCLRRFVPLPLVPLRDFEQALLPLQRALLPFSCLCRNSCSCFFRILQYHCPHLMTRPAEFVS